MKDSRKAVLSIIIPIYNRKQYLTRCVESLRKQSYSNLEIILIDDGSTDGSWQLCEAFQLKDSRIFAYHQENQGCSSARNLGLRMASGEYIGFVDADDWVSDDYASKTIGIIRSHSADIVWFGFDYYRGSNIVGKNVPDISIDGGKEIFGAYCTYCSGWEVYNKVFKRSLLRGISFPKNMSYGEDWYITHKVFQKKPIIYPIRNVLYHVERTPHGSAVENLYARGFYQLYKFWREGKHYGDSNVMAKKCQELYAIQFALNALYWDNEQIQLNCEEKEELIAFIERKRYKEADVSKNLIDYFRWKTEVAVNLYVQRYENIKNLQTLALKVYAANTVRPFLSIKEAEDIKEWIVSRNYRNLKFNRRLLQWAISNHMQLLIRLLGKRYVR